MRVGFVHLHPSEERNIHMAHVGEILKKFYAAVVKRSQPFSAAHFSGHCFRLIPASCSFAASAFPVPPLHHWVPSHKAAARFGSSSPRFWVPQKNGAEKGDIFMSYLHVKWNSFGAVARQRFSH
jgi:hypothetical protein